MGLEINKAFVKEWASNYDTQFESGSGHDKSEEEAIRGWLAEQGEPKYLNKDYFVRLGRWKSARITKHYKANEEQEVINRTRRAYEATDDLDKLKILLPLKGVGVPVASTILHYLQPNDFPIFDYHARTTLNKAGTWSRDIKDASAKSWLEYVNIMRDLSNELGVTLRDLDKALFAYDKYPKYRR